ncbi:MAG: FtsW/RodA/SpoVE family cell cycle protein [Lachnospiraceae bacterium]|jgi:cell division protein FtsW|nr:FtsW/RodA/SpoVE family cell cycle protein [Lachnospiraceae bacterium]RKJ50243.1 FtsW/RodA/SpoVE family cell cycle protein [bacterium 1XD42-54]
MAARSSNLRPVPKSRSTGKTQNSNRKYVRRVLSTERDYFDYNLLAIVILLTCFGLVMLYSTSAYEAMLESAGDDMAYFRKQAVISVGALVLALVGSQIDYHFLARFSVPIYAVSMFFLFITKFIGREVNGAKRWIYFGPISFQPAELAKLAVILFIPVLIVKIGYKLKGVKAPCIVFGFGLLSAAFTYVFTENLSTAIIIAGITVVLVFIAHPKTAPFVIAAVAGAALVALVVLILVNSAANSENFRIRRIQVWIDPESYSSLGGYQVMQGLYAIGSGGFFGKGLGNSAQKLGALPEAQNDMIFSIICEELGVFGAVLVILMFVLMLYRLFFIAQNAPDLLGSLIASGIFVHIALQVVLNIAVVTNMIPTTGITLPFVSYGGTSILFLMAEMALALSVSRQIRFK